MAYITRRIFHNFILIVVLVHLAIQTQSKHIIKKRIVGGKLTEIESIPYIASLSVKPSNFHFCGAAIISRLWLLSAAHCFDKKTISLNSSNVIVRTGTHYKGLAGEVHSVDDIIIHNNYENQSYVNDIALISVTIPFEFTAFQQPIPVAKINKIKLHQLVEISGFGNLENGMESDYLRTVNLYVRCPTYCKFAYSPWIWKMSISSNMFCASILPASYYGGPCDGDSGGPAVIEGKLAGIVSFAINCGSIIFPSVYTNVAQYYQWILDNTLYDPEILKGPKIGKDMVKYSEAVQQDLNTV